MRMEVARQEKLFEMADITNRVMPGYKKALRNALVGDDLDKGLDPSYDTALYHAESRFRAEYAKTEDFQASYDKILTEITEGEDFCKKCVEGYKIDNKKNTVSAAKQRPRKTTSSSW